MYQVDIHPWSRNTTVNTLKIATYLFDNKDKAQEFLDQYNAYSQIKVAVLRNSNLELASITGGCSQRETVNLLP